MIRIIILLMIISLTHAVEINLDGWNKKPVNDKYLKTVFRYEKIYDVNQLKLKCEVTQIIINDESNIMQQISINNIKTGGYQIISSCVVMNQDKVKIRWNHWANPLILGFETGIGDDMHDVPKDKRYIRIKFKEDTTRINDDEILFAEANTIGVFELSMPIKN